MKPALKPIEQDTLTAVKNLGRLATVSDIAEEAGWSRSGISVALHVLQAGGHVAQLGGGAKGMASLWGSPAAVFEASETHAGSYLHLTTEQRTAAVLRALAVGPGSAEEVGRRCGWGSRAGTLVVRGRLSELVRAGKVALTLGKPWIWRLA